MAACFGFQFYTEEFERNHLENQMRFDHSTGCRRKVVDIFEEEPQAAGKVGETSVHCSFDTAPGYN